jgi:hypothetical protein
MMTISVIVDAIVDAIAEANASAGGSAVSIGCKRHTGSIVIGLDPARRLGECDVRDAAMRLGYH